MCRFIFGFVLVVIIGWIVPCLVNHSTGRSQPGPPEGVDSDKWKEIFSRGPTGTTLGFLERIFFFVAFWIKEPTLVAGWLAFKAASGWYNWQHIVKVPEKLKYVNDLDYFRARNQLGSYIFHRFLIGTLANILAGIIAVGIAQGLPVTKELSALCQNFYQFMTR